MNSDPRWLDRIAHDLRGPLSPLQTAAWLLKRDGATLDEARRQELADIVERQSRRLARMVDELGDWARARQGRLLGERGACALPELVDLAIGAVPGCTAEPHVDPGCASIAVECDQHRLVQALRTMLEYAGAGASVALSCREGMAMVDIAGEGLGSGNAGRLLEEPDPAPSDEGLGLRLLLARAVVEAHGGELTSGEAQGRLRLVCQLPASG